MTESASSIRELFFGLVSCGFSEIDFHALTLKRICESVVLLRALYVSELWNNLSQTEFLLVGSSHRLCVKTMQNMDRNTRPCVALSSLGLMSLKYVIVKLANCAGSTHRMLQNDFSYIGYRHIISMKT